MEGDRERCYQKRGKEAKRKEGKIQNEHALPFPNAESNLEETIDRKQKILSRFQIITYFSTHFHL